MRRVTVVVLDLDNTLFDWFAVWHTGFSGVLDALSTQTGVPREQLIAEFKAVHQKHRTSEYAFAVQELPSLRAKYPSDNLAERFAPIMQACRKTREETLVAFDGVLETLRKLKDHGCLLIGYTESMASYSAFRMRRLGLDLVLDYLYSPADHALPADASEEDLALYRSDEYQLRRTISRHTPPGQTKPAPEVLRKILDDLGARPDEVIYVGDSLMKDVAMAETVGVASAWAKYGVSRDAAAYDLLRAVTHWTDADVEKEKRLTARDVRPTHVLERKFSELLDCCEFHPFAMTREARLELVVDAWKKAVDVQQHFNDISLRIRNFAVTLLVAVFGVAAFALKDHLAVNVTVRQCLYALASATFVVFAVFLFASTRKQTATKDAPPPWLKWIVTVVLAVGVVAMICLGSVLPYLTFHLSVAFFVLLAGMVGVLALWFMDASWYHRLLIGAVLHAQRIEKRWEHELPELSLGHRISEQSGVRFPLTAWTMRSADKQPVFYVAMLLLLFLVIVFAQLTLPEQPATTEGSTTKPAIAGRSAGARDGADATAVAKDRAVVPPGALPPQRPKADRPDDQRAQTQAATERRPLPAEAGRVPPNGGGQAATAPATTQGTALPQR